MLHRARKRTTQKEESQRISGPRRQTSQLEQRPGEPEPRETEPQQRPQEPGPPELLPGPQEAQVSGRKLPQPPALCCRAQMQTSQAFILKISAEIATIIISFFSCLSFYFEMFLLPATLRGGRERKGPANTGTSLLLALNTSHQCNIKLCKVRHRVFKLGLTLLFFPRAITPSNLKTKTRF